MQTISRNTGRLVARVLDACGLIGCSLLVLAPLFAQCAGDVPVRGSDSVASASVAHFDGAQKPSPFYAARSEYFAGLTEVVVGHRSQLLVVAHRGRERDRGILGDQRRGSATRAAIRKSCAAINSVGDGGRDRRYASDCKESGLGLVARSSERRIACVPGSICAHIATAKAPTAAIQPAFSMALLPRLVFVSGPVLPHVLQ
jgi:hypothetical protein